MSENEPKKETVRITLPQRPVIGESSAAPVKKETVRINLPARPSLGSAPSGEAKKESTRIANLAKPPALTPKPFAPPAPGAARPAPPLAPRPAIPAGGAPVPPGAPRPPQPVGAAPRPPQAPGAPRPPQAPAGGAPVAPRPPGSPAAPSAPRPAGPTGAPPTAVRPSAPPASEVEGDAPLLVKPTEKKNTARIDLPAGRPAPQPTMKIQQTQPLARVPEPSLRTLSTPSQTADLSTGDVEEDKTLVLISAGVLLFSVVAFALQLMTYLGS